MRLSHLQFTARGMTIAVACLAGCTPSSNESPSRPIKLIEPPEAGFYSKTVDYAGIPIKAHAKVADAALAEARRRLNSVLAGLPGVVTNLAAQGVEFHIIGKDQVPSDLPEHRRSKGTLVDGLDFDLRARGYGGRTPCCGEENLLRLPGDPYEGRDACVHELAHTILDHGVSDEIRRRVEGQYERSTGRGLWKTAYAGRNYQEYFADLSMWYFGTRGDYGRIEPRPSPGREWLKGYDPDGYQVLDDLYSGRAEVGSVPTDPYTLGVQALEGGNSTAAREHFERCLGLDFRYWEAHVGLAVVASRSGDAPREYDAICAAIEVLERAGPSSDAAERAPLYKMRAAAAVKLGDGLRASGTDRGLGAGDRYAEALADLARARREAGVTDPDLAFGIAYVTAKARIGLGDIEAKAGDSPTAVRHYEEAKRRLEAAPASPTYEASRSGLMEEIEQGLRGMDHPQTILAPALPPTAVHTP